MEHKSWQKKKVINVAYTNTTVPTLSYIILLLQSEMNINVGIASVAAAKIIAIHIVNIAILVKIRRFKGRPLMRIKITLKDARKLIMLYVMKNLYSFGNMWAMTDLSLICAK